VQPEAAIEALQALKAQAAVDPLALREDGRDEAWKGSVRTVIRRGLGENSEHLARFSVIRYGLVAAFGTRRRPPGIAPSYGASIRLLE
jgi:hypothetical protein